jgi:flagellar assembly protein FliH
LNNRIRSSNVQLGKSLTLEHKKFIAEGLTPEEIKKQEQEREARQTCDDMLKKANEQAGAIVEEAEKQAAEIIRQAEEEAAKKAEETELAKQQAVEEGYAAGFQKGHEEGTIQAKQEIKEKVWSVNTLTSATFRVKQEIINSAEQEILELSTVIAEKILRQKLEMQPGLMKEIIRSAIEQLSDKEEIKIIINPALTENLYEFAEEFEETIRGLKSIKITEDKTIPRDGVIVESSDSRIDGRIETQLDEIVRNLMREFSEKCNEEEIPEEINIKIDDTIAESENEDTSS